MKTAGIVAEYNPLHDGHRHQLSLLREQGYTHIAVVMSGNLVQRGEPALFDKWTRTQAALSCGADLVLELPAPCAVSSAEGFAYGAVKILDALGSVDVLCFGAETPDRDALLRVADACRSLDTEQLSPYLKAGLSFPAAREKVIEDRLGTADANLLKEPNNILGIEYCKALSALGSDITPLPIPRVGNAHDEQTPDGTFASASLVRKLLREGKDAGIYFPAHLSPLYRDALSDGFYSEPERLFPVILSAIGRETPETLARFTGCGDGLAERIIESAKTARSLDELYAGAKSKRFTHSRIRRAVLAAALGLTADFPIEPPYLRVLGANERGHELIKIAAKQEKLPLYHSFARLSEAFPAWAVYEQRAELFWRLSCKVTPPGKGEYRFLNLHKAKGESL